MIYKNNEIEIIKVTKNDVKFLFDLMLERPRYPSDFKTPSSELPTYSQHENFVNAFVEDNEQNLYLGWYIIILKNNEKNEKVGAVVLKQNGEWGYHILMKYWDKGIGTIAVKKLFSLYPTVKLWGRCKPGNKRAIHQFEKLGFTLTTLTFEKLD